MKNIVYVSDTNSMGKMKFKWLSYIIETLYPDAKLSHCFTPSEVFGIPDENYNVIYDESKEEGVLNGLSNKEWDDKAINPDAIILDDLTRANPSRSEKIYNRSRILYEAIKRNIQVHIIAPDLTMSYAGGLELKSKTKLPYSLFNDFSKVYIWYGVNDLSIIPKITKWNGMSKNMPTANKKLNLITGVCYTYLKKHEKQIRESMKNTEAYSNIEYTNVGYYGFWRTGILLNNIMRNKDVDTVIGSFKWRTPCEENNKSWVNGNKTLEEIFSILTKSYIPSEDPMDKPPGCPIPLNSPKKNHVQHVFRQFEGIVYARDGIVYDENYPENMRVYSMNDPKLKELYGPILSEFIQLLKES